MQIHIQRRAEIALRSLQKLERKQVDRALDELLASDRAALKSNPKFHLLASGLSNRKLAVYRGGPRLRLILTFEGETCTLEDIVDHDRLDRMVKHEGQE